MIFCRAFTRDENGHLNVEQKEWPDSKWPLPQTWLELHEQITPHASGGYIWMTIPGEQDGVVLFCIIPPDRWYDDHTI